MINKFNVMNKQKVTLYSIENTCLKASCNQQHHSDCNSSGDCNGKRAFITPGCRLALKFLPTDDVVCCMQLFITKLV